MTTSQVIDFRNLPKDILRKIPFSLRTVGNIYNIDELPIKIQYLVKQYLDNSSPQLDYTNVYDIIPTISVYNDLTPITDTKQLILEYFKNFLLITLGSYPFDVNFGSYLKQQLQTKDTSLRSKLLSNELVLIAEVLTADYSIKIDIKSFSIDRVNTLSYSHSEYSLKLEIQIGESTFAIVV